LDQAAAAQAAIQKAWQPPQRRRSSTSILAVGTGPCLRPRWGRATTLTCGPPSWSNRSPWHAWGLPRRLAHRPRPWGRRPGRRPQDQVSDAAARLD